MTKLSFQKPTAETMRRFMSEQGKLPFSYQAVGATAEQPPAGFAVDRLRIKLGEGEAVFQAAKTALRHWEHFRLGWAEAWPADTALRPGEVVAVLGRAMGLWWLNACRVVYVVDETGPITRFGFAYGTLPGHAECGEERFLLEWHRADNSVWYDILAFSKPNHVLARLGHPAVRRLQERFRRDSAAAMLRSSAVEPGRYRHYKGREYTVIGTARHSETLEELVVYRPEYGERGLWARPKRMFSESLNIEGREVPRFQFLAESGEQVAQSVFAGLPPQLPEELIQTLVHAADTRIERIVSHAHASPEGFWYDQGQNEWVLVLQGAARLRFENETVEMRAGDYLNIPAHKRHRVEWTTTDEPTIWLAVFY